MEVKYRMCDHCGKNLYFSGDYEDCLIDLPSGDFLNVDLCHECALELRALVGEFIKRKVPQEKIEK